MITNRRLKSALAGLLAAAAAPASAQTPLELEYEEAQRLLNAAIADAVGAAVAETPLPETAFFNPLRPGADFSIIADPVDQLEIKGAAGAGNDAGRAAGRDQAAGPYAAAYDAPGADTARKVTSAVAHKVRSPSFSP